MDTAGWVTAAMDTADWDTGVMVIPRAIPTLRPTAATRLPIATRTRTHRRTINLQPIRRVSPATIKLATGKLATGLIRNRQGLAIVRGDKPFHRRPTFALVWYYPMVQPSSLSAPSGAEPNSEKVGPS